MGSCQISSRHPNLGAIMGPCDIDIWLAESINLIKAKSLMVKGKPNSLLIGDSDYTISKNMNGLVFSLYMGTGPVIMEVRPQGISPNSIKTKATKAQFAILKRNLEQRPATAVRHAAAEPLDLRHELDYLDEYQLPEKPVLSAAEKEPPLQKTETEKERVNRKQAPGLVVIDLKVLLEEISKHRVIDILPSCFKQPDGRFKIWYTILYEDDGEALNQELPYKLALAVYYHCDLVEMRLERLVLCPSYSSINVRGQITIASPDVMTIAAFLKLPTKDVKLTPEEGRAIKTWLNSWDIVGYDPDWKLPVFKW
jgi:hypothetical protein